ncbi:S8 family serine peptidase [Pseudomonas sp. NPDC087615]|uniref:S8 family serine peptidase n=1 Tax=Pseudomonas sp. NPDC087615 TaxID=3364443 RepID=UPI003800844C
MAPRPVKNPVLRLLKSPTPKTVSGGGKNQKGIKLNSLENKRRALSAKVAKIDKSDLSRITFSGMTHIIAKMDDDSLSPSWTPTDVFDSRAGCRIVAPAYKGFLIEVNRESLSELSRHLKSSKKTNDMVDISRISSIDPFDESETLRGLNIQNQWDELPEDGNSKVINVWLKPFKNLNARKELAAKLEEVLSDIDCNLGHPEFDFSSDNSNRDKLPDAAKEALDIYLEAGNSVLSLNIFTKHDLERLVASGTVYRIDPAPTLRSADKPGTGREPSPSVISTTSPTVVIVDGGINARSYLPLQKHSLAPLVGDLDANLSHGNKVVSLVCHAHAWNADRPLPALDCTFISAQAICKDSALKTPNHRQLLAYLDHVAQETAPYSKVWNLSFNLMASAAKKEEVSYLGHELSKIARKYNILPVISAGNIGHNPKHGLICAPADCEAALTISGRSYDFIKMAPGDACSISLKGPAPAGMKKPDLSWFSELRMIGGGVDIGTSFSTPLVSSLAAHTFANIKEASPDLVKALLINKSELDAHSDSIGWGTPWEEDNLPWFCKSGDVTMAWTATLQPGYNYYWNNIPIPPELIKDGKFVGSVALTAVLKPLVSESVGENYFSSRLQTSLQATSASGNTISLAGSMREDKEKEVFARSDLAKWSPVRNHYKEHRGTGISGGNMRLNARIFTRDLYQFDIQHHSELPPQEVAFVLTLRASDAADTLYDSTVQSMRTELESAVLNQDIVVS